MQRVKDLLHNRSMAIPIHSLCTVDINNYSGYGIQRGGCWGCKYFPISRETFRIVCFCDNVTQGLMTVIPGIDRRAAGKTFAEGKNSLHAKGLGPH